MTSGFRELWLNLISPFPLAITISVESFLLCDPTREVYEERIASYRKIFRSHKEYYCQNPLAQKLLTLQAEKEEIESRIKACDDEITVKQKELDHFTGNKLFFNLITYLPLVD